ncbi:class I SAM-dependent methyltransferase, partial [candidate division FCPU426 bacterium]|nr:class I SAM-dependent methyltransferase [candidate division FCPU426 bacterium]
ISKNRIVRSVFSKFALLYDHFEPWMTRRRGDKWRQRAIDVSGLKRPHRILDACTGTGSMSRLLAQACGSPSHIVAVDFCPGMITLAKQKLRNLHMARRVEFRIENVEVMPFPDDFFDAVFISFGLRFSSDIKTVLKESLRILKRDCPLVILEFSVPRNPVLRFFTHLHREYFFPAWVWLRARTPYAISHHLFDSLLHYPDPDKLSRMLIRTGFDEVEYEFLGRGAASIHRAVKPAVEG